MSDPAAARPARFFSARRWGAYGRLFEGSRRLIAASALLSVAQTLLLLPVALLVKHVFDTAIPKGDTGGVVVTGLVIIALYIASAGCGLWTCYVVFRATQRAITGLRVRLLQKVLGFSRRYFDRHSAGELQSIIVQDSERLHLVSNVLLTMLLPALIVSAGLSVIALVLNPLLFAVFVCVVPVMTVLGRLLARRLRAHTRVFQRAFDVFSSQTGLSIRAMTLIKVHGAERLELEGRAKEIDTVGTAGRELMWRSGAFTSVQSGVAATAGVAVLIVGGWATAKGKMTLGELLGFYAIVALLLRQVALVASAVPTVLNGYESIARLEDILDTDDPDPYSGTRQISFKGELTVDAVTFSYGREPLLHDVSLSAEPGSHLALVGPNGAGKSTLVNLLLGLYRPQHGAVLADGVPYDELDMPALRRRMGVVLQDPLILPGTIAENIAYGRPDANEEDIRLAAEWATANDFIVDLPDGYETRVGDDGGLLSGGQRQRIAIARALLARPVLVILDEPTTHLDDSSIRRLMANLKELPGSPTLLLISHDPEVARLGERVYNLRDGGIVEADALGPLRSARA